MCFVVFDIQGRQLSYQHDLPLVWPTRRRLRLAAPFGPVLDRRRRSGVYLWIWAHVLAWTVPGGQYVYLSRIPRILVRARTHRREFEIGFDLWSHTAFWPASFWRPRVHPFTPRVGIGVQFLAPATKTMNSLDRYFMNH